MERLTKRLGSVGISTPKEPIGSKLTREADEFIAKLLSSLAAYEDTGMAPEEIVRMGMSYEDSRRYSGRLELKLKAYIEAKENGRLVVLPCKVGDTVWILMDDGAPCMARVQGISISASCKDTILRFGGYPTISVWGSDFGKTWFRSAEEAKTQLKLKQERREEEQNGRNKI